MYDVEICHALEQRPDNAVLFVALRSEFRSCMHMASVLRRSVRTWPTRVLVRGEHHCFPQSQTHVSTRAPVRAMTTRTLTSSSLFLSSSKVQRRRVTSSSSSSQSSHSSSTSRAAHTGGPRPPTQKVAVGDVVSAAITFTADDVKEFARLSGDRNPIHVDTNAAIASG